MKEDYCCTNLSDSHLISEVKELVAQEFKSLAELLAYLSEIDSRKLYARLGYSSLFAFVLAELHLSEDATYRRIQAARAGREFPVIFSLIAQGRVTLTTINILSPILTEDNHEEILRQSVHKTRREIEQLKVRYAPQPEVPDMVRRMPQKGTRAGASTTLEIAYSQENGHAPAESPGHERAELGSGGHQQAIHELAPSPATIAPALRGGSGDVGGPARRDRVEPLTERRVKFQFTGGEELRRKLERAKDVCRHKYPHGRLEDIIDEALEALLEKKDPQRKLARKQAKVERRLSSTGQRGHPAGSDSRREGPGAHQPCPLEPPATISEEVSSSRHIPQDVKDIVWQRDEGRCRYVSPGGKRCGERGGLEFDHIHPWALGGTSTDPCNIRLLCRLCRIRHNRHYADFRIMPTSEVSYL